MMARACHDPEGCFERTCHEFEMLDMATPLWYNKSSVGGWSPGSYREIPIMNNSIDFSDLEDDFDSVPTTKADHDSREKFPCLRCKNGIATWGLHHQHSGPCHDCNGRGYFLTSPQQRQKARTSAKVRRVRKAEELARQWRTEHPDLSRFLEEATWSEFAQSLSQQGIKKGGLSEKQLNSAYGMLAKCDANKKAREEAKPSVDLTKIRELIETARSNGVKKPILRAQPLRISEAPANGKNAGFLYVKWLEDDSYIGKISPEGVASLFGHYKEQAEQALQELAEDPSAIMVRHGRTTGRCGFCGRELTHKISIEHSMGPICAERWGFDHLFADYHIGG